MKYHPAANSLNLTDIRGLGMLFRFSQLTIFIFILVFIFALSGSAIASLKTEDNLSKQRQNFLLAEKYFKQGKTREYEKLKKQLVSYPLYPYLEYRELTDKLHRLPAREVRAFIENYSDAHLSDRLLKSWLSRLAKSQKWEMFLDFYQPVSSITLQCNYLNALIQTGKKDEALDKVADIWLYKASRPKACDPVFKVWKNAGLQTNDLTWQRIALAVDDSEIKLARYLGKSLPKQDQKLLEEWLQLRKHPEKLSANAISANHPYRQLALAHGVMKFARKDLTQAVYAWEELKFAHVFDPAIISKVEQSLSYRFLSGNFETPFEYLVFSEPCDADTKLQEIRIRAALRHQEWNTVLSWLDKLPETHATEDRWQYWRARGLEMTGKNEEAVAIFETISQERSFYGFLAADKLDKTYSMNHSELDIDPDVEKSVAEMPSIQRASELFKLKRYLDARREWYASTKLLDEEELQAAAKIAHSWQWHDRAIITLAKAKSWDDLQIRFPVKHKDQVFKNSERSEIDPAWIYAMMRQESAFMPDAISPVGARGLMQLMPATAKSVARKLKQRYPSKYELLQPEKNILLGTTYLKEVYQRFENPVLAIAAYNAGPHRVKRWLPEDNMPADIWIELVPFKETRNYLKNVLAYTVIYAEKLDEKDIRMKQRMPIIAPAQEKKLVSAR